MSTWAVEFESEREIEVEAESIEDAVAQARKRRPLDPVIKAELLDGSAT